MLRKSSIAPEEVSSPGALSHIWFAANFWRAGLSASHLRIWAAGYMSYDAVSRELNRRQVPPLRGGKQWYPMTAGRSVWSVWNGQGSFLFGSPPAAAHCSDGASALSALQLGIHIVCARRRRHSLGVHSASPTAIILGCC